jgi:hypothetical protein
MAVDSECGDGDSLTVASVNARSVAGGLVTFSGEVASYSALPGFAGPDRFSFVVSDGRGGRTTAFADVWHIEDPTLGAAFLRIVSP